MPQFQLLVGRHRDLTTGKMFEAQRGGKKVVVESAQDLDKLFAEKFRRLDGPTKKPRDRADTVDASGKVMDEPLHKRMAHEKREGVTAKRPFRSADLAPEADEDGDDVFKDDDEGVAETGGGDADDHEFSQEDADDGGRDAAAPDGDEEVGEADPRTPARKGKRVGKKAKKSR